MEPGGEHPPDSMIRKEKFVFIQAGLHCFKN